jgi:hypothetical protein
MRRHFAIAACVLTSFALSSPARGDLTVVGPTQDYKAEVATGGGTTQTLMTAGYVNIYFGTFTYVNWKDALTIHSPGSGGISGVINVLSIGYVASPSGTFTGPLTITTIYGIDLNPSGSALSMTGVNPNDPQFSPTSDETLFGLSGTAYTSNTEFRAPIAALDSILGPGYDLSPFAQGDPNSEVYGFQTIVPAADFVTFVPEPSTLVYCAGAGAMLGGLLTWRRRRCLDCAERNDPDL